MTPHVTEHSGSEIKCVCLEEGSVNSYRIDGCLATQCQGQNMGQGRMGAGDTQVCKVPISAHDSLKSL